MVRSSTVLSCAFFVAPRGDDFGATFIFLATAFFAADALACDDDVGQFRPRKTPGFKIPRLWKFFDSASSRSSSSSSILWGWDGGSIKHEKTTDPL